MPDDEELISTPAEDDLEVGGDIDEEILPEESPAEESETADDEGDGISEEAS